MFLEYDWTFDVYRPRAGRIFTDWRGVRSFATLRDARNALQACGCDVGRKTDSRTWEIVCTEGEQ